MHVTVLFVLLIIDATLAHVPPSHAEMAHLKRLQERHAEAEAKKPPMQRRRALEEDYSCSDDAHSVAEPWKVSGTSLGGWLVLEPWLTPSLFYQFLGADVRYGPDIDKIRLKTGMDQKSFCTALGPAEANRQLLRHWRLWVTEEHIADIAKTGSTHVRIPIGDWMFKPYDIYDKVEGGVRCNDGAIEELDRALKLCHKYGLKVLLDMHAWIGSQNGLDNSGETKFVQWASKFDSGTSGEMYAPKGTFEHWANKGWDWIINSTADWGKAMQLINAKHWDHSVQVLQMVVDKYGKHPAIWGLGPVNEVGAWTPMDVLRKFYWEGYGIVRKGAPHWMYVMDSSFRGSEVGRDGFMKGCPNKALDKHPYHAWAPWGRVETYYKRSCDWAAENKEVEDEVDFPVIAGEWSLAMDTCAMWLLGFNDMQPGEPRAICDMVPCPCSSGSGATGSAGTMDTCYLAAEDGEKGQPSVPLPGDDGLQGPFGSGISGPMFGRCPREMALSFYEDEWMTTLAHKQLAAFNAGHGWFFWNFRTEHEPHWDFLEAWRRGWFPRNVSDLAALDKLNVCAANAAPLKPTTNPILPGGGIYNWLSQNWQALVVGAVGGVLVAVAAVAIARRAAGGPYQPVAAASGATPSAAAAEDTPYVAMITPRKQ